MMYEQLLPSCSLSQSYVELCLLQPLNKLIASENHYYYLFLVRTHFSYCVKDFKIIFIRIKIKKSFNIFFNKLILYV